MGNEKSQISVPDNKPLIFYLRQYEKRFRDFAEQLEFDASYLMRVLESPDYRGVLYKEKFENFDARCINILGEVVYYRTLILRTICLIIRSKEITMRCRFVRSMLRMQSIVSR